MKAAIKQTTDGDYYLEIEAKSEKDIIALTRLNDQIKSRDKKLSEFGGSGDGIGNWSRLSFISRPILEVEPKKSKLRKWFRN